MIPRSLSTGFAVSLLATTVALVPTGSSAAPNTAAAAATSPTNFALSSFGYGTRVLGGDVPAGSDRSAYQVIGCTDLAGLDKNNFEAGVDLRPLATAAAVSTRTWTTQRNGVVSSWARNHIARVRVGDASAPGTVLLRGIESTSRAYHDASGFHSTTQRLVGSITIDPDGSGPTAPQQLALPTAGDPLLVPGVLKISLGPVRKHADRAGAFATADALVIEVLATSSKIYLAHSHATIHNGVYSGLFRGSSYGSRISAANAALRSKMTPFTLMPCQGTNGKIRGKDIVRVNPEGIVVKGLSAYERSDQTVNGAYGWERGRVTTLNVGGGSIVATGIVGQANVEFVRGRNDAVTTSAAGTRIGSLRINGETQTFPRTDVLNVPGVAKFERDIVSRSANGISVTALRVTLLDGSGAVINLGRAKVSFGVVRGL